MTLDCPVLAYGRCCAAMSPYDPCEVLISPFALVAVEPAKSACYGSRPVNNGADSIVNESTGKRIFATAGNSG